MTSTYRVFLDLTYGRPPCRGPGPDRKAPCTMHPGPPANPTCGSVRQARRARPRLECGNPALRPRRGSPSLGQLATSGIRTAGIPCSSARSLADFGGASGPVSGGEALPGDSDVGVDTEGSAEDSGGDLGGELQERGAPALVGRIPKLFSRWVSCAVLIGPLGSPPGKTQDEGANAPMVVRPLRFTVTKRVRSATGLGWYRHITFSMVAAAFLTVTAHRGRLRDREGVPTPNRMT